MSLVKTPDPSIFNNFIVYNDNYNPDIKSNSRPDANNTILQDILAVPDIFNVFLVYEKELKNSTMEEIALTSNYDFRPDKLANEYYGNQLLYPIILIANDLCSIMQFRVKDLNFSVKLPDLTTVQNILNKLS